MLYKNVNNLDTFYYLFLMENVFNGKCVIKSRWMENCFSLHKIAFYDVYVMLVKGEIKSMQKAATKK